MKMTGAQAIVQALGLEGVEIIFGYPGGAILPVYDALRESKIHHVLVRHEQAAAHAASGYARSTGKTGVCIATSGPGATNLITGIATAYLDSIPMVAITGQVPVSMIGRDVFQEIDITGATEPFTKHNYLVKDAKDIPRVFKEAFHIASTGRPGPVLIDVPKDVAESIVTFSYPEKVDLKGYKPTYQGHPKQIKRMIKAILESKRPLICVGGGAVSGNACREIFELAERINAPVATTLMGIGAFPSSHPLSLGMLGQHGIYAANRAVAEADLLIVLGARMGDRATGKRDEFAHDARIVHIDIDPAEIGKNIDTHIPIVGDVQKTLKNLLKEDFTRRDEGWLQTTAKWKTMFQRSGEPSKGINPAEILNSLSDMKDSDTILVTDVGQHQIWAGRCCKVEKPRTFLTSGGLGTMGYGLPAAIGAKLACPHSEVILITGDGGFQMSMCELATLVQEKLNIKILMFNNHTLGMVRELQHQHYGERYYQVRMEGNPDFVKLAQAYGIDAVRIEDPKDASQRLRDLLKHDKALLIELIIDEQANVMPLGGEV
jgi:acetolactate synthase-1/2/3 large subunit